MRDERAHQTLRDVGLVWFGDETRAMPAGRGLDVAGSVRAVCEPLQRADIRRGELLALRVGPPLELRGVLDEKAVEKRSAVSCDRRDVVAGVDGLEELADVRPDECRIDVELV